MLGLSFKLSLQLQIELLHNGALVRNCLPLFVRKVRYISHLRVGLPLELLVKGDTFLERFSEAPPLLDWVSNGLECFKTTSLLFEGRVFSFSINPCLGCEQIFHEGGFEGWVNVVL